MGRLEKNCKASTPPKKEGQQDQLRSTYANTISPSTENADKNSSSRNSPPSSPNYPGDDDLQFLVHTLAEANEAMLHISQRLGADYVLKLRDVADRLSTAVSAISIDDLDGYPDHVKEMNQMLRLQYAAMSNLAYRLNHEVAKAVDTVTVPDITMAIAQPCIPVSESSSPCRSVSSPRTTASSSSTDAAPSVVSADKKGFEIVESRPIIGGDDGCTTHKYRCGDLLGQGGFAKVHICTKVDSGKQYAIKILSITKLAKGRKREKERLQNEIKIHSQLAHKHVCKFKHSFEDKSNHYLLLELCPNETVRRMIERRGRLTEPETKYYMLQLLEAVKYLHQKQKIVHRDLKPFNLFLDKSLNLKVGDFGLAIRLSSPDEVVKMKKSVGGSPTYMSPEVVCVKKKLSCRIDPSFEVDLWSMGAICFALLVGKSPFKTNIRKADDIFQRILDNQYDFPGHIPVSAHARDFVSALLQTDPQDRLTLDKIQAHSFFTHDKAKIPATIPLTATHLPPDWREDDKGTIYAVANESDERYRRANIGTTDTNGPDDEFPSSSATPGLAAVVASEAVRAARAGIDVAGNVKSDGNTPKRKQKSAKKNAEDTGDAKKCSTNPSKRSSGDNSAKKHEKAKNERFADTGATSTPYQTFTNTGVKEETRVPLPEARDDAHLTAARTTDDIASASDPPPVASTAPAKGKKKSKRDRKKGKKSGKQHQLLEQKKQAPPQDAPASDSIDSRKEEKMNESECTASNPNAMEQEDEERNDETLLGVTRTKKELSPGDKARAEFWGKEREHQQLYTNALTGWAVAECARRKTQALRSSEDANAFERAFIDPEEIKENSTLMKALTKQCETAYKTLYGHRTGGTVKIVDSSDNSLSGRFGKIIGQGDERPETFKIELLPTKAEKMAKTAVEFAVVSPMNIELAQGDTSKTSKKKAKKGGGNSKKKTKKTAGKTGPPREYTFAFLPPYDYGADEPTVTTSDLDDLTADAADLANMLDTIMGDRNEREEQRMLEVEREVQKRKIDRKKERVKTDEMDMDAHIKHIKKTARTIRSYKGLDRVPLSERLGFETFVEEVLLIRHVESVLDRDYVVHELRTFLDGMTDFYDSSRFGMTYPDAFSELGQVYEIITSIIVRGTRLLADKFYAASAVCELYDMSPGALVGGKVFVMLLGCMPIYSYKKDDPRFCKKGRYMDGDQVSDDEEKLEECADLLGVPPYATKKEVNKAFRKKALKYHPDKFIPSVGMTKKAGEELFKELSAAAEYMIKRLGCDENE